MKMEQTLLIYNTLSRKKERFEPIHSPNVGMYVCGPTVYGDPHLGHARPAITFDILFRYLKHLGYKVRYVRNITDVGHLEHDADEGDDKIEKKARLEQLEPMEIAQYYTNRYHHAMEALNVLPPSIEPHATGHIIEQEELVKEIMANGYAYESNGSTSRNTTKTISMAFCPAAISTMSSTTAVSSTEWERSATKSISLFGKKHHPSTSCDGQAHGAMASRDGTASAPPWDASILATTSIFMEAVWTLCSPIMSAR